MNLFQRNTLLIFLGAILIAVSQVLMVREHRSTGAIVVEEYALELGRIYPICQNFATQEH